MPGAKTPSTVAFLDVSAGVAGDMCLGALVDAGLPLAALQEVVAALKLDGVTLTSRRVHKGALSATKVDVILPGAAAPAPESMHAPTSEAPHRHETGPSQGPGHPHPHSHPHPHAHPHPHPHPNPPPKAPLLATSRLAGNGLREILAILRAAKGLPPEGLADAIRAFTHLAEAEGRVHGIPAEEVHFHEVGALDAIVDIVGTCVGLRRLGVLEVRSSPLPWFTGRARMAHGELPLPAPAVAFLMVGHPTFPSGETFEQVTPTGAALVKALSRGILPPVGFVPRVVGLGAGDHPGGRLPNVVRLVIGEAGLDATPTDAVLLETNLDDATGQEVGRAIEQAIAKGALDAWATPATMKKGRPGVVLSVLVLPADVESMERLLLSETPTLGIRRQPVSRTTLPRRSVAVTTVYGPVHVKVRVGPTGEEGTPEYDDCRAASERTGVAWRTVAQAAQRAWEASRHP